MWIDEKIHLITTRREVLSTIQGAIAARVPAPVDCKKVIILYGIGGTGKSTWVRAHTDLSKTYQKDPSTAWWDLLEPTMTTLWIDDIDGQTSIPLATMKIILDNEAIGVKVNAKNMPQRMHHFSHVIITSNYPPRCWYKNVEQDSGFMRRVKEYDNYNQVLEINQDIWTMMPPVMWQQTKKLPSIERTIASSALTLSLTGTSDEDTHISESILFD